MYYTYILYSKKLSKYYVGQTQDLEQRLIDHNVGRTKYAKKGIPWDLVYYFELSTRSEAIKLETRIKSRGIKRFLTGLGIIIPNN